jgi:hypothetical protein
MKLAFLCLCSSGVVLPQACWPYLACVPMSPGHAHTAWPSPEAIPGFEYPLNFISQGSSYGYPAGHHAHSTSFAAWPAPGYAGNSHLRDRQSGWRRSQAGASNWSSNGSAIVSSAGTAADARGLSGRGGRLPAPRGLQADRPHEPPSQVLLWQP